MKVLFAASECVPFIKTGGLADVIGSLPIELARLEADVRVILPKYRIIDPYWKDRMEHVCHFEVLFGWQNLYCGIERVVDNGVTYYFVDNEEFFSAEAIYGDGQYEGFRFAFFCRAVLEALPRIGFFPDILHCNDWQTGLIPALLRTQYLWSSDYRSIKTVFSIHNLQYQGIFNWNDMAGRLGIEARYNAPQYLEFYGNINFMKGGLVFSEYVLTVSPTYAKEIKTPYYGERLDGLLQARYTTVSGILNGIDTAIYDPATDRFLPAHYTAENLVGKAENKALLQEECGLEVRPEVPVIGMIARLSPQKGFDLIERVLDDIMQSDVQLIFLGKGDRRFVDLLNWANWRYPRRLHARIVLDEGLAHRIYAGSDMFLMPSQFEPCGLSQMISLRYGTVPIVRETGGLKDTIVPYNLYTDEGNGFSFANYNAHEMLATIQRAVRYYFDDKPMWARMVQRGMAQDFSWQHSAKEYQALYKQLLGLDTPKPDADETATQAGEQPTQPSNAPAEKRTVKKQPEPTATDVPPPEEQAKPKAENASDPAPASETRTQPKAVDAPAPEKHEALVKAVAPSAPPTADNASKANKAAPAIKQHAAVAVPAHKPKTAAKPYHGPAAHQPTGQTTKAPVKSGKVAVKPIPGPKNAGTPTFKGTGKPTQKDR